MTCTIWAVIHAYIAVSEKPPKAICSSAVIFASLAFSNAFVTGIQLFIFLLHNRILWPIHQNPLFQVLVFAYWGQMPPDQLTIDVLSLHQHTFLAVITLLDLLVTQISLRQYLKGSNLKLVKQFRWYHLLWSYVYGACYTSNAVIAYALGKIIITELK